MEKYIYKAKLQRVVDGDTVDALIDLGFDTWVKRRIRFMGVDTWECRTRNKEEKVKSVHLASKQKKKDFVQIFPIEVLVSLLTLNGRVNHLSIGHLALQNPNHMD